MGAKGKNFYVEAAERFGQGDAAREVQDRFISGDRAGAAAALTPELIDRSAVCCRPGELDERLAWYERAGATTLPGDAVRRPARHRGPARQRCRRLIVRVP